MLDPCPSSVQQFADLRKSICPLPPLTEVCPDKRLALMFDLVPGGGHVATPVYIQEAIQASI
jgi:hypothetical protein